MACCASRVVGTLLNEVETGGFLAAPKIQFPFNGTEVKERANYSTLEFSWQSSYNVSLSCQITVPVLVHLHLL